MLEADILPTAAHGGQRSRRPQTALPRREGAQGQGAGLQAGAPRDITNEGIIQQLLSAQPPPHGGAERRGRSQSPWCLKGRKAGKVFLRVQLKV